MQYFINKEVCLTNRYEQSDNDQHERQSTPPTGDTFLPRSMCQVLAHNLKLRGRDTFNALHIVHIKSPLNAAEATYFDESYA